MEGTSKLAYCDNNLLVGAGKGNAFCFGFRPRDDQSASLGYETRTLFEILDRIGAYAPSGNLPVSMTIPNMFHATLTIFALVSPMERRSWLNTIKIIAKTGAVAIRGMPQKMLRTWRLILCPQMPCVSIVLKSMVMMLLSVAHCAWHFVLMNAMN